MNATVDTSRLNARIEELSDALIGRGQMGDAATVFEDEGRRFLEATIRITPPKNKLQGENAIRRDLKNIFTPVNEDFLDDLAIEHGTNNIDTWKTSESGKKKHILWNRIDQTGQGMKVFHNANRRARGRTRNLQKFKAGSEEWYSPYAVTHADFETYAKTVQNRVGRRKAGWAVSLLAMAGQVSTWIKRNAGIAKGSIQKNLTGNHPSVSMRNYSPGILEDERVVKFVLKARERALSRRLKLLISGYAADFKSGRKVTRKAVRTNPEFVS